MCNKPRRHYEPKKTATFERRATAAGFRSGRISRPAPLTGTRLEVEVQAVFSPTKVLGDLPSLACATGCSAAMDTLRPVLLDLVEVEVRQMRTDVVEYAGDGVADPVVEGLR